MRTRDAGSRWKHALVLATISACLPAVGRAQEPGDPRSITETDEPPAVAVARAVDERESWIRALISGELDVEIDPQSLFDVPLSDDDAIAVETTRLRAVVARADELVAGSGSDSEPGDREDVAEGQDVEMLRSEIRSLDPESWKRRIDLDRARLDFYSLGRERREEILARHVARQQAAAPRESEQERRLREAEAERQRVLEAARIARTEAERLVGEEDARLILLGEQVARVLDRLEKGRAELAERRDVVFGWQRRVREATLASESIADETYDALRRTLRSSRDELARALEDLRANTSDVPPLGDDPLRGVPDDVPTAHVRERRLALAGAMVDVIREERAFREARATALQDEITTLNQERLGLLPHLSPEKRRAIVGFTVAGFDQARAELRHLSLILRYHDHALRGWIAAVRSEGASAHAAWSTAKVLVPWMVFTALFVLARRRTPGLVRSASVQFAVADRAHRRTLPSPQTRAVRVLGRIHRHLEWIVYFFGTIRLMPIGALGLLEVRLLSSVVAWILAGRLVVSTINAIAAVSITSSIHYDESVAQLRLRSLRLVGRTIVSFVLILIVSVPLVGEGTVYSWALSLGWLAAIVLFFVLVRWWRGIIFSRLERARRKSKLEAWILLNRSGWKSFAAATIGAVHLFSRGVTKILRRSISRFELARRIHAYIFQLEIERLEDGRQTSKRAPLDEAALEALHPARAYGHWLACPADEQLEALVARVEARKGGMVAVIGALGMGKSSLLRALFERVGEGKRATCDHETTLRDIEAILRSESESASHVDHDVPPMVLLDDVQAVVKLVIGGLHVFDEINSFARARCEHTLWVFAIDSSVWPYLVRSRDSQPIFDEIHVLEPWDEHQIGALLTDRCADASISPIFDDLLDPLPLGSDELDRWDALKAKQAGYERMLWDHVGGNPGIALEVWRSSLAGDDAGTVHVRPLQVPDASKLDELPDSSLFVLRAVIQMAPAAIDDVAQATRLSRAEVLDMVRFGEAKGLLVARGGRIRVAWHWIRPIMRLLERRHMLVVQ